MKRKQLLSINSDAKTIKGLKQGFLTGILYLAPSTISGYQVCPMAKLAGCEKACLYTAGRGAFNSIQNARIAKTKRFFNDKDNFMLDIIYSINSLIRKAKRQNLIPLVRLNGTSDIKWENVIYNNQNIFELFPDIQFYDYTKIPNRKKIPSNYDLTFSYSGVKTFQKYNIQALKDNKRIAVVFDKVENIPITFYNKKVISGDNSDIRHLDAKNSIIALYAKGKAKKDLSGFVVRK